MSDDRLRQLEREWKESRAPQAEAAYLSEAIRAGERSQKEVELAALFGAAGPLLVCGNLGDRTEEELARLAWSLIEPWLRENAPAILANLRPGASAAELQAAEERLGLVFPGSLRWFWSVHNGQKDLDPYLFDGYHFFLTLEEIVENVALIQEHVEDYYQDYEPEARSWASELKQTWWTKSRFPFAQAVDGGGNYSCIDLAPSKQGRPGQVVDFSFPAITTARILAPSFGHLLAQFAFALLHGRYRISAESGDLEPAEKEDSSSLSEWIEKTIEIRS